MTAPARPMIATLIDEAVILDAEAPTKEGFLDAMLDAMVAAGRVQTADRAGIGKQLREREALGSTGIGNGIAVPHVKSGKIDQICLALARSGDGIDYQAIDGLPVHTVFLILAPVDQAESHLQALRWISSLARNGDFRRFVQSAGGEAEVRDLLREMSPSA